MMRRRVGAWTLRWARGPGRHSALWALNAFAIAALPALSMLEPACRADFLGCSGRIDVTLMVPRLLALPALLVGFVMLGSAHAQRKHAHIDRDYFARLENADHPDIPPGHFEAQPLEQDLTKRTLRGISAGALIGSLALTPLFLTRVALRSCDPWATSRPTGLQVCSDMAGWTDLGLAMETVSLVAFGLLASLVCYSRSTSITVEGLPRRRRRLLGRARPSR